MKERNLGLWEYWKINDHERFPWEHNNWAEILKEGSKELMGVGESTVPFPGNKKGTDETKACEKDFLIFLGKAAWDM